MIDIEVDLTPFSSAYSEEVVQNILADIADSARNHWIMLAGKEFHTTRRDYIAGIQPVEMRPGVAVISLVGALPNILENDVGEVNLRDWLLGPNVPVAAPGSRGKRLSLGADGSVGYYRAIPFRHATPDSSGTVAPRMGSAYEGHQSVANSKELGAVVYGKAKKLKATTSSPGGGTEWGGRLEAGLAPLLRPHHKTDIYAGMVKEQKTYNTATQSQYATFRTISTRTTEGWIRGARPGSHLAAQVGTFASGIAEKAFAAYAAELAP